MGKIFEVFGYPVEDRSSEAEAARRDGMCPFMGMECDGGGNRYLSSNKLDTDPALAAKFNGLSEVPSGVCSIRTNADSDPWIVCPRRLLVLGREKSEERKYQAEIEHLVIEKLEYPPGTRLGIWPELKMKAADGPGSTRRFDYTFDYVVMPLGRLAHADEPGLKWRERTRDWEMTGYTTGGSGATAYIDDAPCGRPTIIEVMTSSTSGGDKSKGTTIPQAFREAILTGQPAKGPGINYRQVWARMVSQLIVKSEVAAAWGGSALWVIQDVLAQYIADTTALDMDQFKAGVLDEVNVLALSYGAAGKRREGVIELPEHELFAGPISPTSTQGFLDIIRAGVIPPRSSLVSALLSRLPVNEIHV